ncbi:flagellin [Clostridium luticellarii]|jgi:flagellin|uniref:flagellin n=1 Tax=Clostridium luticellarii TaxID=1691940 RepID=UPI002355AA18|nr:flagellin [Clostridium luticellarii]MCI1943667.1 flagellin [Clostridium luticellarii]MCI1968918.1 flagellin [Clostridium luticellarii]MCI1994295.1 flagellin [Clostridium luticellarii]MCI2038752.1 flagellin [Clostridium luticellarii]
MRISYNMPALILHQIQNKALERQSGNLLRISSGLKLNSAKDNPSGMVQSQNMKLQIGGLQAAARNVQDGVSMLQTAEGGLQEITSMIQRIRDLTMQAGNGTTTPEDRGVIQNEIDQMLDGISSTADQTEFNGLKLLAQNGKDKVLNMPTGANAGESTGIPQIDLTNSGQSDIPDLYSIRSDNDKNVLDGNIGDTLGAIDDTLDKVVSYRSKYGALENRFEANYDDMQEITDQLIGADSDLSDADVAEEILNYSKENIITEASNAMIAQANKLPQDVLRVLENVRK